MIAKKEALMAWAQALQEFQIIKFERVYTPLKPFDRGIQKQWTGL
jgi:hypothetical protein